MHRFLIGAKGEFVDHINGDGLDNRKSNLRLCSNAQNVQNTGLTRANTSGYKGIRLRNGRWDSRITCLNKTYHLGVFSTKEEAARAYNAAAIELHGEFARLNDV